MRKKPSLIEFTAVEIGDIYALQAPKEYRTIDVIAAARPQVKEVSISLHVLDGTSICAWYICGTDANWKLASPFFMVTQVKKRNTRLFYEKRKKFIEENFAEAPLMLLGYDAGDDRQKDFIDRARKAIGYSNKTASCDIHRFLDRTYEQVKNSKENI